MAYKSVTEIEAFRTQWSELPDDITGLFSAQERLAYHEGAKFIKDRLQRTGESYLIELSKQLSDDHPMRVYIERANRGPTEIWFGFTYLKLEQQPQFRLAGQGLQLPELPERLAKLFAMFSGIRSSEDDEGGFRTPRFMAEAELQPFADSLDSIDSQRYVQFFNFGNSDIVAWGGDESALLFDHETNDVFTRGLDDLIDSVFSDYLRKIDYLKAMEESSKRRKK
jgi:hypothetical protein